VVGKVLQSRLGHVECLFEPFPLRAFEVTLKYLKSTFTEALKVTLKLLNEVLPLCSTTPLPCKVKEHNHRLPSTLNNPKHWVVEALMS
jgi:hypothetical protein